MFALLYPPLQRLAATPRWDNTTLQHPAFVPLLPSSSSLLQIMLFGRYPFDPPAPAAPAGDAPPLEGGGDSRSGVFTEGMQQQADSGARRLIECIMSMQVGLLA